MSAHFISKFHTDFNAVTAKINFLDRRGSYTEFSYARLWEDSLYLANELQKQNVEKGSLVLIVFDTSYEYLKTFIAIQTLNATAISIYPPSTIENKNDWLKKSLKLLEGLTLDCVCTSRDLKGTLKGATYFENIPFLSEVELSSKEKMFAYTKENLDPESISFIQFSSGTTGASKAIAISQKALASNIDSILHGVGDVKEAVNCVSWLPLYHDMGLVGTLLASLVGHGELTLIKPEDFVRKPYLWMKAISDKKANVTVAPNFAYGLVAKRISDKQTEGLNLSSLKVALCGAEMVHGTTLNSFIQKFSPFYFNSNALAPVYGMAEGTLAVSFSELNQGFQSKVFEKEALTQGRAVESSTGVELCSVGCPVNGVEVYILDDHNNELAEGRVGEIAFYSKALFSGLLGSSGLERVSFSSAAPYRTGDQGFILDGKLYICGRIKEMMIIRGKNYLPTFFESKIQELAGIRKGKVVAFSTTLEGQSTEVICLVAEHDQKIDSEAKSVLEKEITKVFADEGLALSSITLVAPGVIPRTTSGKLKRVEVKKIVMGKGFKKLSFKLRFLQSIQKFFS